MGLIRRGVLLTLVLVAAGLVLTGCDDDGGNGGGDCSNADCAASCRSSGFPEGGHCEGTRCQCDDGGCTPSCSGRECGNDGCGGNCGTCSGGETCSDGRCTGGSTGCSRHTECSDRQICVAGDCVAAYGHDYQLVIVEATGIPEASWEGSAWDFPGGLPDPFVNFIVVGGDQWSTPTANDTLHPVWHYEISPLRINESTRIRWELRDADLTEHDPIIGFWDDADAFQMPIDAIRDGAFSDGGEGITINFTIEPL